MATAVTPHLKTNHLITSHTPTKTKKTKTKEREREREIYMNQPEKTHQPWIKQTSLASKQGITHTPMNTLWFIWLMALRFLFKTVNELS